MLQTRSHSFLTRARNLAGRVFSFNPSDLSHAVVALKADDRGGGNSGGGNDPGGPPNAGPGGGPNGPGGKKPAGPQPPSASKGILGIVVILTAALIFVAMINTAGRGNAITLSEFRNLYDTRQIEEGSVVITDDTILAKQKAGQDSPVDRTVHITLNTATSKSVSEEVLKITKGDVISRPVSPWSTLLMIFGPILLVMLVIWFFIRSTLRSAGGGPGGMLGNFGKSRHKTFNKEVSSVTFADVAGVEEAKDEVQEIVEFLKNPKRFTRLGGRIPRGVLLSGDPGCGKTLLAKAIAGEAEVPFFSISGSDFVEMFVGVGASRVRDLFKTAKENSPCIIFLDEIDAVGRRRGGGFSSGGHDEREQTLNAILVEMDGFNTSDGIIVIAATNRPDVLDPALTRPGRFDRQIAVSLPDVKGRLEILKVHARKIKLGPDVDLERVARGTPMFSGADLAAIINEAAISATLANKDFVEQTDLEEARDKVRFGRARKSRRIDKEENRATAYHEAGHAVVQALLKDADPLHKVTIIPRGQALGATFSLPEKDRLGYGLRWISATMRVLCGGRIAEERATGDITSGASMDIQQVTNMARHMILDWGMSPRLGFVRYSGTDTRETYLPDKDYSDETAKVIDDEIKRLVDEAYAETARIISENWEKVSAVAEALIKYETITGDDVHRLIRGEPLGKPSISDLLRSEVARKPQIPLPEIPSRDSGLEPPAGAIPSPA
jgi:cell division protease FtsH